MMSKKYSIAVWDIQFYKVDEDGNELLNDDGSVKLFCENSNFDYTHLVDSINDDELKEMKS
jgi:hypothetical protein